MGQMKDAIGGCGPADPPTNDNQPIRAFLQEMRELGPEDYRGVVIPMYATLDAVTVLTRQGKDVFRVPSSHLLAITSITGFMAMPAWQLDDAHAGSGNANTDAVIGMMLAKAMTTMLTLVNSDRDGQPIFEGKRQVNLSSILGVLGGKPIDWKDRPHIVPAGDLLELSVVWNDSTVTGPGTEGGTLVQQYGINLVGYYIRTRRS